MFQANNGGTHVQHLLLPSCDVSNHLPLSSTCVLGDFADKNSFSAVKFVENCLTVHSQPTHVLSLLPPFPHTSYIPSINSKQAPSSFAVRNNFSPIETSNCEASPLDQIFHGNAICSPQHIPAKYNKTGEFSFNGHSNI